MLKWLENIFYWHFLVMPIHIIAGTVVNIGTEPFVIGFVGHGSPCTVGLLEGIFTLDMVAITLLLSVLHVPSVMVIHCI